MGFLNEEQAYSSVVFVSVSKDSGLLRIKKLGGDIEEYPGIEGQFVGIDKHAYEYKGQVIEKLDIYLEDEDRLYQVQLGLYSGIGLTALNCLASVDNISGILKIATRKKGEYATIKLFLNKKILNWKYSVEEMGLSAGVAGEERRKKVEKLVNKLYERLSSKYHYSAESEYAGEFNESEEPAAENDKTDDLPF